ncbi:MAG TPA: glycosyltransferase [Chloroflexi bacterium]|nr:glycosyltransferase [Chloroflexota bacterium]
MITTTPVHPFLSVIIPTYNREKSLLCTLDSLQQQTLSMAQFEVIVVNDGGHDATHRIVHRPFPFRLRLFTQVNQGAAAARNHGAQQSEAEILVFIDDDITLEPGYLAAIVRKSAPGILSMGSWLPYLPSDASVFARTVARSIAQDAPTDDQDVAFTECTSNNLAVHRMDFYQIGMWQDLLGDGPTLWGDVVFGYKAWKSGFRLRRLADARLTHRDIHLATLSSATRRAHHVARIAQPLLRQYPEIGEHLSMFYNKTPINWRQDSLKRILRKSLCRIGWSPPGMWLMESAVPWLERYAPETQLLQALYGWIISGNLYQGYREGLRAATQ